jgi:hypothetical protein
MTSQESSPESSRNHQADMRDDEFFKSERLKRLSTYQKMRLETPEERAERRARILDEISDTAARMLAELDQLQPSEVETVRSRLMAAVQRKYDSGMDNRGVAAGCSAYMITYFIAPAILLIWSANSDSLLFDVTIYVVSLLAGPIFFMLFSVFLVSIADWFMLAGSGFALTTLWTWSQNEQGIDLQKRATNIKRARRQSIAAIILASVIAAGILMWLRHGQSIIIEILCIALLTPTLSLVLAFTSFTGARISQPHNNGSIRFLLPGDSIYIDLFNLAFLTNRSRLSWQDPNSREHLLCEFEKAARRAGFAFTDHFTRASGDPESRKWALEESARLAAGLRWHKRAILLADEPSHMDLAIESLCSGLIAAANGSWSQLTVIPASPKKLPHLKRFVQLMIPPAVLISAAIIIPEFIKVAAVSDSARLTLIIAAILALITAISPGNEKAAETILDIVRKGPGGILR